MKILIAEDDLYMQKILGMYLEKEGFKVHKVADGEAALTYLTKEKVDLAVLDWMMPKIEGVQVAKYIRQYYPHMKIIMLTAKGEVDDELMGLNAGADDYIKKPFEPRIFVLRVKKLLGESKVLSCHKLKLNLQSQKVFIEDQPVKLSRKEFELLEYFLQNKGLIISREMLLECIWGIEYEGDERTVDTHIRRLRSKIGEKYIKTYRGIGYSMEEQDE